MDNVLRVLSAVLLFMSPCHAWSPYHNSHMAHNRSVIVQMFEWRFDDIGDECEKFLGPYGYGAVQVSPVNEYAILDPPTFNDKVHRPWYERYQSVSYKIMSRSGDEKALKAMVKKCNDNNVRVYIDIILNHMTGGFVGNGTAGSPFDGNAKDYPGVPFTAQHFNSKEKCGTASGGIENIDPKSKADPYSDPHISRYCELAGLKDLDQFNPYVREKQIEFLNKLIDMGVAGFRVDAAKHMFPETIKQTMDALKPMPPKFGFNAKPFVYHETATGGEPETGIFSKDYTIVGKPINFRYMHNMRDIIRKDARQKLSYARNYGMGWGFIPDEDSVPIVDNHDAQRTFIGPDNLQGLSFRHDKMMKMANAFMLGWPYGHQVKVMSSYRWPIEVQDGDDINKWYGPPANEDRSVIERVTTNDDLSCNNGWVCEHRYVPFDL